MRPVVGIPCDLKTVGIHPTYTLGRKYGDAVAGAGCLPLPLPPLLLSNIDEIFALVDGICLSGAPSNVHPKLYDGAPPGEMELDPARDSLTLPLILEAVAREVPLLCICRGIQELNVAYGGTLHPLLHAAPSLPGHAPRFDHREDKSQPLDVQYGPAHTVTLTDDSRLAAITGKKVLQVNSIHGQGIDRLADGLTVEGRAEDGTIEAVRVQDAGAFALGIQWHPEWRWRDNPDSTALFAAFGEAVAAARQPAARQKRRAGT